MFLIEVGHLWNSLADYYIRSGLFERARDVYEESIQTVTTVRDFTQVLTLPQLRHSRFTHFVDAVGSYENNK